MSLYTASNMVKDDPENQKFVIKGKYQNLNRQTTKLKSPRESKEVDALTFQPDEQLKASKICESDNLTFNPKMVKDSKSSTMMYQIENNASFKSKEEANQEYGGSFIAESTK